MRDKLLMPRQSIKGMGINDLRAYLAALEDMRARGDTSQMLLDTHAYVLYQFEVRGLSVKRPEPRTLLTQSEVYMLKAATLREYIRKLQGSPELTEKQRLTLYQLQREEQRRKDHSKYIYRKRKARAEQCSIPL